MLVLENYFGHPQFLNRCLSSRHISQFMTSGVQVSMLFSITLRQKVNNLAQNAIFHWLNYLVLFVYNEKILQPLSIGKIGPWILRRKLLIMEGNQAKQNLILAFPYKSLSSKCKFVCALKKVFYSQVLFLDNQEAY